MNQTDQQTYIIVKQVLDQCREDANLASESCREDIAKLITTQMDQYINRLIEDIVSPCGIPSRS